VKLTAIATCAVIACASPAAAQSRWAYPSSPISPYEIHATLRSMHLRPIGRAGWLGRHIAVRAVDRYGEVMRVLLDPRYGDVVSVVPLASVAAGPAYRPFGSGRYRPYDGEPRYGEVPPDVESMRTPPPAAVNPPASRSAALTPPRVPLPRPRPAASPTTAAAKVVPEPVARPATPAPEPMARPSAPAEQPASSTGAAPPAGSFTPVPSFE
jgi:hypothetical protein